jgi:hypothetical protein
MGEHELGRGAPVVRPPTWPGTTGVMHPLPSNLVDYSSKLLHLRPPVADEGSEGK